MTAIRAVRNAGAWELAAEAITVKIRWFGLVVGLVLVNRGLVDAGGPAPLQQTVLNAVLALGTVYASIDTLFSLRKRVFLGRYPLVISAMEALFIGILCHYHTGLDSPFRFYYFVSLICCAVRHPSRVTYATCALHGVSCGFLYAAQPTEGRDLGALALNLVMLGWVTYAAASLASLLKHAGESLVCLNEALRRHQTELEGRIADRTRELQEAQAHMLHQEKMAAFGLLAAGIAHEVGNPLTSISSMVQMLQRREDDPYTLNKLALVSGQLLRIRTTLRELIEFSRPASGNRSRVALADVLDEALSIAKYYKRSAHLTRRGGRIATPAVPPDLPPLVGVRDQLVQVFLNLVLNAIDATDSCGRPGQLATMGSIVLAVEHGPGFVEVSVRDRGTGITAEQAARLFQPYFTTKKHGTGLGLFVTRRLVADHGGEVTFRSEPDEGTTFTVRLPVANQPRVGLDDPAQPTPASPPMALPEKEKVA